MQDSGFGQEPTGGFTVSRRAALRIGVASAALLATSGMAAIPAPIDRRALVDRHAPQMDAIDPHAAPMLGNGRLAFSADITGLQSLPEQYSPHSPLLTMAQWSWHSFPNPKGYGEQDGLRMIDVPGRGEQPYAAIMDWSEVDERPALAWLRENPHHFALGRIALTVPGAADGIDVAALTDTHQRLDLWRGALHSSFRYAGAPVAVETRVHPDRDMVLVEIRSPLIAQGKLGAEIRYPGVSRTLNPDPADWETGPDIRVSSESAEQMALECTLGATVYHSTIAAPGGTLSRAGDARIAAVSPGSDRLVLMVGFSQDRPANAAPSYRDGVAATTRAWRDFWTQGGVVDFSGSTDPRAHELERRVVLSQYLSAINGAGDTPPQEDGLYSNSWNGKFHLEMHGWHTAHFATWGRPQLLERSLGWYLVDLPHAQERAKRHDSKGAWWPKMTGPDGNSSPSTINPFIMWQQPTPIFLAELLHRAGGGADAVARYAHIVDQTAELLASWPHLDPDTGRYQLGPPVVPVQENYDPLTTRDPVFELEYFRWGLQTAQRWRERRGRERNADWDTVIAKMAPLPERDGLYLPVVTRPDFWQRTASAECSGDASAEPCMNRDHPSFLMAYGLIAGDRVDTATMRRTLSAAEAHWDWRQTWGWDFPMIAMTAARLGEPEKAVDWLFRGLPNNQWGSTGMTPRFHLDPDPDAIPDADGSVPIDGSAYIRDADTYMPSNGSLLLAIGMMAAGWDGASGAAPGFPATGWMVRTEGLNSYI